MQLILKITLKGCCYLFVAMKHQLFSYIRVFIFDILTLFQRWCKVMWYFDIYEIHYIKYNEHKEVKRRYMGPYLRQNLLISLHVA